MGTRIKAVDDYIHSAQDFAKPILNHLRDLVHQANPGVEESVKWGMPHFGYKGMLCNMAAFKNHCSFGFWKANLLQDPHQLLSLSKNSGMGQLGKIHSIMDLPDDSLLIAYIEEAVELNEKGIKPKKKIAKPIKELVVPRELTYALSRSPRAKETFDAFSYSHKKEYIEWISEAKTDATRNKRLATTLQWLEEGKPRNWKYTNC